MATIARIVVAALVGTAMSWAYGAPSRPKMQTVQGDVPAGKALRIRVKFNVPTGGEICLWRASTNAVEQIRWNVCGQRDEHEYIAYAKRSARTKAGTLPPTDDYPDCGIRLTAGVKGVRGSSIPCLDFSYWFLPYFSMSRGLYEHAQVVADMPRWKAEFPQFDRREMTLEFVPDATTGKVSAWVDRQLAGYLLCTGQVARASVTADARSRITFEPYDVPPPADYALPALPARSAEILRKGAKIVIDPACRAALEGIDIWNPAESVDQGRHRRTTYHRDFGWDPMGRRTPWANGPEYMQWRIPAAFYLGVDVLCADIPRSNRVAVVGSSLTRFGSVNQESYATAFTDLATAPTNGNIRKVGTLAYADAGRTVETPLYLVRQRLDIGKILNVLNDATAAHLDFEFVGAGTHMEKPRSSVQIFGAAFRIAPYAFAIDESERGNIFENDERPETGVMVTALKDDSAGKVVYAIRDDDFKVLRTGERPFKLAKRGDAERLSFDLAMPEVGWYMLDYDFLDGRGRTVATHHAAFTLLGRNDREAGFESPYACWPQGTGWGQDRQGQWGFHALGRHNCNPDHAEVAKWMHKAGYHTAWSVPCRDENEFPEYQLTLSAFWRHSNGPYWPPSLRYKPEDAVVISNCIEEAVACYREEMARYPHCKTIQIFHEQGYKSISQELLGEPAVRGEYKGIEGNFLVYWATEFAKRMRKEFPDCHLQIGNGSSSCELIAMLCREGFDLNLVDTLGIESKGFQTMPELANNLESPGMLWALKATAERFGYTNKLLNACNEYVFRPERPYHVSPDKTYRQRMRVTDFTLRDYLISLAHGCWTISTGHPEDCNTPYYDTNWGAGGQCTFYPHSYPKRMFTALANLTKVMDKVTFSRCFDTGANATYFVEFRRDRKVKDFAYAYWTAYLPAEIAVEFPKGTEVTCVDWQGRRRPLALDVRGAATLVASSTPAYLIAGKPAASATFVQSVREPVPGRCTVIATPGCANSTLVSPEKLGVPRKVTGVIPGHFTAVEVNDPEWHDPVLEMRLEKTEPAPPEVMLEKGCLWFDRSLTFDGADYDEIGIWVRGNGAFGKLSMGLSDGGSHSLDFGYRSYVCHDGWQLLRTKLPEIRKRDGKRPCRITNVGFSDCRQALNPRDMVPVKRSLRFGPIVGIRLNRGVTAADPTEKIDEAMKQVDEKDL